ncbi:sti1 [Symbiodinium natans]|uniref:Sti1 protein n=1 Tax=Symbiodinium natans TaxID=878477 RepID=A0A812R8C4_9DINO|nr:sti1 [Symbiodinium natans]
MATAGLQAEGKRQFQQGHFREALRCYAAALRALEEGPCDQGQEGQAATLRANRSLCLLRLGDAELALSEAEQCKELRPDWPKAHFRIAAALKALGRLGEARLAACEARRLAPGDPAIQEFQAELRRLLFPGPTLAFGEALDLLEDFTRPPTEIRSAAQQVRDALLGEKMEEGSVVATAAATAAVLEAFLRSEGPKTIFRRQNAMGENWQEEARNGTMSVLSEVTKAGRSLEQELLRLNTEAEERERGCQAPGCSEPHLSVAGSKAADSNRNKAASVAPPPQAFVDEESDAFLGISAKPRRRRQQGAMPDKTVPLLLNLWSDRAVALMLACGWPATLSAAAAVAPAWAQAVTRFGTTGAECADEGVERIRDHTWRTWLHALCPGALEVAGALDGPLARQLLQQTASPPTPRQWCFRLDWCFLVVLWKAGRRLWTGSLTTAHASSEECCGSSDSLGDFPTYERCLELSGEPERSHRPLLEALTSDASVSTVPAMSASATAARGTTLLPLTTLLHPGAFDSKEALPHSDMVLRAVLGFSVGQKETGPDLQRQELRVGLGFVGG